MKLDPDHFLVQPYLEDLRQHFDLAEKYRTMAKNEIQQIKAGLNFEPGVEPVTIGVHFRGTDFAAILKTLLRKHHIGIKYYQKAFQFYRDQFPGRQLIFLIVTDDRKLARHNLQC